MGVLIGGILGLIILGIITLVRNSKARAHADGMRSALDKGGSGGRAALDKRIGLATGLFMDTDVERQSERLAALGALGDLDAVASELELYTGSDMHVTTVRSVGYLALAVHGRDPGGQSSRFESDLARLEAAGTNKLTLRVLGSFAPVIRALAGRHTLTDADRAEAVRFQASPVVKRLLEDAFARLGKS